MRRLEVTTAPKSHFAFCHRVAAKFSFKLCITLVQSLKSQLPAMKLDIELVDVTFDFRSLRFVLQQVAPQLRFP